MKPSNLKVEIPQIDFRDQEPYPQSPRGSLIQQAGGNIDKYESASPRTMRFQKIMDRPFKGVDAHGEIFELIKTLHQKNLTIPQARMALHQLSARFSQVAQAALLDFDPQKTGGGCSESFFLHDQAGEMRLVFKPSDFEPGGLHSKYSRPLRPGILAGQGAGHEVMAFALDRLAFGGHYKYPVCTWAFLKNAQFKGVQHGPVMEYIPNMKPFGYLGTSERNNLPRTQIDRLNFRLIMGDTDAHDYNIGVVSNKEIINFDAGLAFAGKAGLSELRCYFAESYRPTSKQPMTGKEYFFLSRLDVNLAMRIFEEQARYHEAINPVMKKPNDEFACQRLRFELAKLVGQYKLTQNEWYKTMSSMPGLKNAYYDQCDFICSDANSWEEAKNKIDWAQAQKILEESVKNIVSERIN